MNKGINKKVDATAPVPPFVPSSPGNNLKNNVFQVYAGFLF
jgi:hypothetical protein